MGVSNISELENYTIALFREKFSMPCPVGSGILVNFTGQFYLISAFHVFDMEDERLRIENDPEEEGIPQDDMEGIYAKGVFEGESDYFYVNETAMGIVFTTNYDKATGQFSINEDIEYIVCKLDANLAQCFIDAGKSFYSVKDISMSEMKAGEMVVLSGYPEYVPKGGKEVYRSYKGELSKEDATTDKSLLRINFDNFQAYCFEKEGSISIPEIGIKGMSGGGIWYEKEKEFVPIGIILSQGDNYVEGYPIDSILRDICEKF